MQVLTPGRPSLRGVLPWFFIALLGVDFPPTRSAANDHLGLLRGEVRNPPLEAEETSEPKNAKHHRDDDDEDCDLCLGDGFGEWILAGVAATVAAPFWGPYAAMDEGLSVNGFFPAYPYAAEGPGHMLIWPELERDHYTWSTRLSAEYANLDPIQRVGMQALWEHTSRFGVDASLQHWTEDLGSWDDTLATGDVNLTFRFAQSEHAQLRTGVGVNWLADEVDTDLGFNFTYGGDVFPVRPWIFSANIDWGRLGHASLFHFRTTAGVILGPAEMFTGYDYFDVGDAQFDGLIAGLRFWL